MNGFEFHYPRYLDAKETVDDRALNVHVENRFFDQLLDNTPDGIRILEVGGGTGPTLLRILNRLHSTPLKSLYYRFIEQRPENISRAEEKVVKWSKKSDYRAIDDGDRLRLTANTREGPSTVLIHFDEADFFDRSLVSDSERYDAVVVQAVLDQVDLSAGVTKLNSFLRPGGKWYLPIHFDGHTDFHPVIDPDLDEKITKLYDESIPHPRSGRQLLTLLPEFGSKIIAAGSSDWIVYAGEDGYKYDEEYFLECILLFFNDELRSCTELADNTASRWIRTRRDQLENNELIYISHQMDICAVKT